MIGGAANHEIACAPGLLVAGIGRMVGDTNILMPLFQLGTNQVLLDFAAGASA